MDGVAKKGGKPGVDGLWHKWQLVAGRLGDTEGGNERQDEPSQQQASYEQLHAAGRGGPIGNGVQECDPQQHIADRQAGYLGQRGDP